MLKMAGIPTTTEKFSKVRFTALVPPGLSFCDNLSQMGYQIETIKRLVPFDPWNQSFGPWEMNTEYSVCIRRDHSIIPPSNGGLFYLNGVVEYDQSKVCTFLQAEGFRIEMRGPPVIWFRFPSQK